MMSLPVCRSRLSFSNQLRVVRHSVPRTCASLSRTPTRRRIPGPARGRPAQFRPQTADPWYR